MPKFGPGSLVLGETGSELDASCLVNSFTIEPSKSVGDSTTKLCGTVRPGATTYTYAASGNVDLDSNDPAGLFALTQANPGREIPFKFIPSEGGTSASGTLVLDPLAFGGEEFGADMTSDFEFDLVGPPLYTFPDGSSSPFPLLEAKVKPGLVINGRQAVPVEAGPVEYPSRAAATEAAKSSAKKTEPELVDA